MRTVLFGLLTLAPALAQAFCGFYVGGADALFNSATQVVMMRAGTTTVLSMQNDYRGPPRDFALVVPVPVVLEEEDVKTLDPAIFARVDRLAAPRLVEYWEQDPCAVQDMFGGLGVWGTGSGAAGFGRGAGLGTSQVTVEAQFAVGEYEIVILSARDSAALDAWLQANGYRIPRAAGAMLRPYVQQGMKFFVAKVAVDRVKFVDGRAVLSPLRVAYESKDFRLPIRLGLLNSSGTQDLLVHILARDQRYEAANYPNVTIPTNLDVKDGVRDRFGEFYAALFDRVLEQTPGAVVTEYAWRSTTCDPCPGPVLSPRDLMSLGADRALPHLDAPGGVDAAPERPLVKGALDVEVIRRITRRRARALRYCAEKSATRGGATQGRIEVEYIIDPRGRVQHSRVVETVDPDAANCMARQIRRWRFPQPRGGGLVVVRQPFSLKPAPRRLDGGPLSSFVLTRLHARYAIGGLGEDLVFAPAHPIAGGREAWGPERTLRSGAARSSDNQFQARYAIRHPWKGPIACESPVRGRWGGPPEGQKPPARAATDLAMAKRGALRLEQAVSAGIPALGVPASR